MTEYEISQKITELIENLNLPAPEMGENQINALIKVYNALVYLRDRDAPF